MCDTKPFLWWVRVQGRSPHAPGISKNAYGPISIPLITGPSVTGQWTQPLRRGQEPVGKVQWGRRKSSGTEKHRARSVPQITRPAEALPGNWSGSDRDWSAVFDARPTLRACMAQGLFLGGTGRRAVAHTRPEFAKNALGPVGIPPVRRRAMNPTPSKGEGPLRPKAISRYRDTLGQIRAADNTAGRNATRQLERFRSRLICLW